MRHTELFLLCLMAMDISGERLKDAMLIPRRYDPREHRILGGSNAANLGFVVYIQPYDSSENALQFCAGALLNSTIIITTASCVYHAVRVEVSAGDVDLSKSDNIQTKTSTSINIDPQFFRNGLPHDVAIIRLKEPGFDTTPTTGLVKTIPLPASNDVKSDGMVGKYQVNLYGWGYTDKDGIEPDSYPILKSISNQAVGKKDACTKAFKPVFYNLPDSSYCLNTTVSAGLCTHDLSGPVTAMMGKDKNIETLVGLASNIINCPSIYPNVIARIDTSKDFIKISGGPYMK